MPSSRPGPKASPISLTVREIKILNKYVSARKTDQGLAVRAEIVLFAFRKWSNTKIARMCHVSRVTVNLWRDRYAKAYSKLRELVINKRSDVELRMLIESILRDAPRPGTPARITAEQKIALVALACEPLPQPNIPQSQWDAPTLAAEAIRRGIVTTISTSWLSRLLEKADIHPHKMKYYLNPGVNVADIENFQLPAQIICKLYRNAINLAQQGIHVISTDECTGIQALERMAPSLPVRPGKVECIESDYIRHGTRCLIANFDVATGQILLPTIGPTRTEADFLKHIQATVETDPEGTWIFILDGLNTHMSEGLVQWVAEICQISLDLGIKGKSGILKSKATRKTFLQEPSHRIRFAYTPKHCSWLNQIEIWFGRLRRKLLKRGNFQSVENLTDQLIAFIKNYNLIYAHPYRWTWAGSPLMAN